MYKLVRLEFFVSGIKVLGVIENMMGIRLPFSSVLDPLSGTKVYDKDGNDVTSTTITKIKQTCPELLDLYIHSDLFKQTQPEPSAAGAGVAATTPETMARKFGVPFLGSLPMDPKMTKACEQGESFVDLFPTSVVALRFQEIVRKIIDATS